MFEINGLRAVHRRVQSKMCMACFLCSVHAGATRLPGFLKCVNQGGNSRETVRSPSMAIRRCFWDEITHHARRFYAAMKMKVSTL
jgi:hypothetical protein